MANSMRPAYGLNLPYASVLQFRAIPSSGCVSFLDPFDETPGDLGFRAGKRWFPGTGCVKELDHGTVAANVLGSIQDHRVAAFASELGFCAAVSVVIFERKTDEHTVALEAA